MRRLFVGLPSVFASCVLILCDATSLPARHSCPKGPHPLYSSIALSVHDANAHWLSSPDGRKRLKAAIKTVASDPNGMQVQLAVDVGKKRFEDHLSGWGAEIAWSSDSKAFFVTQTEGGGGIGIRAYVFYIDGASLRKVDVSRTIEEHYGRPAQCGGDLEANVAAVAWLEGSQRLLMVAEDPPVAPLCHCPGAFTAYEMQLPENAIVKSFSQAEAKRRFSKVLGCQLRDADDNCAK